jgi:hypothetical protein
VAICCTSAEFNCEWMSFTVIPLNAGVAAAADGSAESGRFSVAHPPSQTVAPAARVVLRKSRREKPGLIRFFIGCSVRLQSIAMIAASRQQ